MRDVAGRNKENRESLQNIAATEGVSLEVLELDVTDDLSVQNAVSQTIDRCGHVDVVINNAGFAAIGITEAYTVEQFQQVFDVNVYGALRVNRAVLPHLRERRRGLLIHVSSGAGRVTVPAMAAYCASKFAVRGFTESLHHELAPTNVGVTCVHPGFVRTAIAKNAKPGDRAGAGIQQDSIARFNRVARTDPQVAARKILRGVERGKARILIGADAYFVDIWQRLKPESYWNLLAKQFEDPGSTKTE